MTLQTIATAEQYFENPGRSYFVSQDNIVRRLSVIYERYSAEDQVEIKSRVDFYISQAKILHLILQKCSIDTRPIVLLLSFYRTDDLSEIEVLWIAMDGGSFKDSSARNHGEASQKCVEAPS
jgi:hypothetical protein